MKTTEMRLTIIIPTYRGIGNLFECLKALQNGNDQSTEIVVVDCETPMISEWLSTHYPSVKVIHFEHDIGLGRARNEGFRLASKISNYIAFLDSDTIVEPGWSKILIQALEADRTAGAAQSKILLAEDPKLLDHTGLALDLLGTWVSTQGLPENSVSLTRGEILCASTAAAMVKRETFVEVGGFDPYIRVCDEDMDLSWRIWLSKRRVIVIPRAVAYHSKGFERDLTLRRIFYSVRNRPYILLKNSSGFEMFLGASLFEFLSILSAVALLIVGRGEEAYEVLRAVYQSIRSFPSTWKEHMRSIMSRRIQNSELFAKGLLRRDIAATVWDISSKVSSFGGRSHTLDMDEHALYQIESQDKSQKESEVKA